MGWSRSFFFSRRERKQVVIGLVRGYDLVDIGPEPYISCGSWLRATSRPEKQHSATGVGVGDTGTIKINQQVSAV